MEITLEKIELVKDRTGVSYREAKEALEKANGSVVDAIIDIEESIDDLHAGKEKREGIAVVNKLKELIKKGNVSKILIKKDDEVILNLPVNFGIVAGVVAPWAAIIGVIAAFGTKCVIEVVKDDGSIIDISEMTNETIEAAMEKGAVFADELKSKSAYVYETVKEKGGEAYEAVKGKAAERAERRAEAFDFGDEDLEDEDFCCSQADEEDSEEK